MIAVLLTNWTSLLLTLLTGALTLLVYNVLCVIFKYRRLARLVANVPGPPRDSLIYGNAKLFFDEETNLPSSTIAYTVVQEIAKDYDG